MMTFDPKANTILLGTSDPEDDFISGTGVFFVNTLHQMSKQPDAPQSIRNDWRTIAEWLGCDPEELTREHTEKISLAWKSYMAKGIAPSLDTVSSFRNARAKYKRENWRAINLPSAVEDVFDRMLATDKQIATKRNAEIERIADVIKTLGNRNNTQSWRKATDTGNLITLIAGLSRRARIIITVLVTWCVYVMIRTSTSIEFLGHDFQEWEERLFWINLLAPPIFVMGSVYIYRWIAKGKP